MGPAEETDRARAAPHGVAGKQSPRSLKTQGCPRASGQRVGLGRVEGRPTPPPQEPRSARPSSGGSLRGSKGETGGGRTPWTQEGGPGVQEDGSTPWSAPGVPELSWSGGECRLLRWSRCSINGWRSFLLGTWLPVLGDTWDKPEQGRGASLTQAADMDSPRVGWWRKQRGSPHMGKAGPCRPGMTLVTGTTRHSH